MICILQSDIVNFREYGKQGDLKYVNKFGWVFMFQKKCDLKKKMNN